ncbi:MAG: hypothetical protein GX810_08520 [Clostridiales bacterium]|nr:hypothetical protein [Clostridiales bacterium]
MNQLLVERHGDTLELALLEEGLLTEYRLEEASPGLQPEAVYKGRVGRVMNSLQAVFVRITAREEGFLPFDEMRGETMPKPGDAVLVQVKKAPTGGKAAYLTQDIALAGRYAVLLPMGKSHHVSARAGQSTNRKRLMDLAARVAPPQMALVLRSSSVDAPEDAVRQELAELARKYSEAVSVSAGTTAPALILPALDPVSAMLRDVAVLPERILTNDPGAVPGTDIPVETAENPFLLYRVRDSLSKALRRRVHLRCGAELVVDPCEAMTVFDVNTAQATQDKNRARTILNANLEAVQEVARLMRLRNIGGIVVIDLIDMDSQSDREQVLDALKQALLRDPVKTVVHGFTRLGLLEITRRKTSDSLRAQRLSPCPACGGSGQQMTPTPSEESP